MVTDALPGKTTNAASATAADAAEKQPRSIFDVATDFFDSCRLLNSSSATLSAYSETQPADSAEKSDEAAEEEEKSSRNGVGLARWTCNTCKTEFESLQEQRSHFKSDIHRLNIKLSIAGKATVKEDDFDELTSESVQDYEVSSISGSEDETDTGFLSRDDVRKGLREGVNKKKLSIRLRSGERVYVWKSLIMDETESVSYENDRACSIDLDGGLRESDVLERLRSLIHETRDSKHLRVVLLASGGHFAGSVFDGKSVVAHKTFHRYVVRAKAGKKQSSKDGSGRSIHSAGASLRRYNELALKKDIQELLDSWKPYFDASSCVFIHAPSNSRQLLFNGSKPYFNSQHCSVRNVPFTIRRPTFKESQRIYNQLTQIVYEAEEMITSPGPGNGLMSNVAISSNGNTSTQKKDLEKNSKCKEPAEDSVDAKKSEELVFSDESEENEVVGKSTPLHEAAKSGDCQKVLELLEQGMNPCAKDERGKTPYMLASEKEVRNTFRRFMALNLDKWEWHAAKVPSALTKEMEESQAAKQAEKDAKKKARAKELKKLRKAREKKAQAEAAHSHNAAKDRQLQVSGGSKLSKEEELKREMETEREKRAAAAERRMAAASGLNGQGSGTTAAASASQSKGGVAGDINCSCCNVSLAGKIPFHRYNYKYCSTSCMHVHREVLEDG